MSIFNRKFYLTNTYQKLVSINSFFFFHFICKIRNELTEEDEHEHGTWLNFTIDLCIVLNYTLCSFLKCLFSVAKRKPFFLLILFLVSIDVVVVVIISTVFAAIQYFSVTFFHFIRVFFFFFVASLYRKKKSLFFSVSYVAFI